MKKKKVLWLSRHKPSALQQKVLEEKIGEVDIFPLTANVRDASEVHELMAAGGFEEIVAVLPINILADLTERGIYPIKAVMNRHQNITGETRFKFSHYERIKKVVIENENL